VDGFEGRCVVDCSSIRRAMIGLGGGATGLGTISRATSKV